MSVQAQREAGGVLFWAGVAAMALWWAAAAAYCTATHTWDRPINHGPGAFGIALGIWAYSMLLGGAWWLLGWRATR